VNETQPWGQPIPDSWAYRLVGCGWWSLEITNWTRASAQVTWPYDHAVVVLQAHPTRPADLHPTEALMVGW